MKRSLFIKSFILFFDFLLSKPTTFFASLNSIKLGDKVAYFLLNGLNKNNPNTEQWSLDDFFGKWLILYFFPKDFLNDCTLEARVFQDNLYKYERLNASIVRISTDNKEDHESFCSSSKLVYTLLSNKNGEISTLYDSWLEPYSKRNTYIINPRVIVIFKWIKVRPLGHAQEVLKELVKKQKIYA